MKSHLLLIPKVNMSHAPMNKVKNKKESTLKKKRKSRKNWMKYLIRKNMKAMLLKTDARKSVHQKMLLPVHTPLTLRETIKRALVLQKLSLCL